MLKSLTISTIAIASLLYGHCQVPCGIYDDAVRIIQMKEDVSTIQKSMIMINDLSENSDSSQDMNQIIRWVNTKEEHARNIQTIVSDYFLTQRIKFKDTGQDGREKYVQQTTVLQQLLVAAMKCRQTVDVSNCKKMLLLIDEFSSLYFSEHGLKHLQEITKK